MTGISKSSDPNGAPSRVNLVAVLSALAVAGLFLFGMYAGWARYNAARFAHEHRDAAKALEMAARVALDEQLECPSGWRAVWETIGFIDDGNAFFPESPTLVRVDWSAYRDAVERARLDRKRRIKVDETILMPHE